ncbi:DEAD/DEAH box helicase [bacterium]|nr:DEAD/DEAH box helicase [bacterium]
MDRFNEVTVDWFRERFSQPTPVQSAGWNAIQSGQSTLLAAPTGSGKTLAAFLTSIDSLLTLARDHQLSDVVHTLYVSPLKALSADIHRNLEVPLAELSERARSAWGDILPVRAGVRTGDTPARDRQRMLKHPPHILVTTPESFYLVLTSPRARQMLEQVQTVIVDEIHALARDKRGSHLSLSLERLDHLVGRQVLRIGISATQKPMEAMAGFLVGCESATALPRPCTIVNTGHVRHRDLNIETPSEELAAVCSNQQWDQIYNRLVTLIEEHRSTIIFVNTRRLAERLSFHLSERLGKESVTSHHGSLAKEHRFDAESRLKSGELKAIVATASLELGIDVGYIDLVCQIGSPRSISTFLQRVGRSGHSLGATPKGRLFPLTRDELLESLALLAGAHEGILDTIDIPTAPLDILAQQIVAMAAHEEWAEDHLYQVLRQSYSYRELSRSDFDSVIKILSERPTGGIGRGAYLHRDRLAGRIKGARGSLLVAATSGGAIPDNADYRVLLSDGTLVGTVNEDFAIDSMAGQIFLLGNTSWRILRITSGEVIVEDAGGAPPSIPFWFGEAPGRTFELSQLVARIRRDIAEQIDPEKPYELARAIEWIVEHTHVGLSAASQAAIYVAAQKVSLGIVPDDRLIIFERFFDEMGGQQLVIHSPMGTRINRAWGLALRKRFCRSFDFELQASADDDGVLLSLGPQHSFPIDHLFTLLNPKNGRHLLEQAILDSPLFRVRWRWNATRSLSVPRQRGGKRVPPPLQRFRSDDLLTLVFPASTACLENRPENIEIPDHPIVRQTIEDCLFEATDLVRWLNVLDAIETGQLQLIGKETREPSPFSHERLNARPYAFLDDAPLEERRSRAVTLRRTLTPADDLSALDPAAIDQASREVWPQPRDLEELFDLLRAWIVWPDASRVLPPWDNVDNARWNDWLNDLHDSNRVSRFETDAGRFWVTHEGWPIARSIYTDARLDRPIELPASFDQQVESIAARTTLIKGWMETLGPTTPRPIAEHLGLPIDAVERTLEMIEADGSILRGRFTPGLHEIEWCDRRTLARIHRYTQAGFRRRLQPIEPATFMVALFQHHGIAWSNRPNPSTIGGPAGLKAIIQRLAGFEAPAGTWENELFPARVNPYEPAWLDELSWTGQVGWGRLQPPTPNDEKRTKKWTAGLTRAVPISIFAREDLDWLLPIERSSAVDRARGDALAVWQTLTQRGALFAADLAKQVALLPAHLDQALGELASLGLISADGFASIRSLVAKSASRKSRAFGRARRVAISKPTSSHAGRWSIFPPDDAPADRTWWTRAEHWAALLLDRYLILFRDLLTRETAAPPWWQIAAVLRRWEAQGKVQGGRFVRAGSAEQYARPGVIDTVRQEGDNADQVGWAIISACDPLNLVGIFNDEKRVSATPGSSLILWNGRWGGTLRAGEIEFHPDFPAALRPEITHLLPMSTLHRSQRQHQ